MSNEIVEIKNDNLIAIEGELVSRNEDIKSYLPANINANLFITVAMDAVRRNPDLQQADRSSLIDSCIRAAQDGLLCDGKEAALTIFNTKEKRNGVDVWTKKVQYMPMISGIRKKILSTGEITKFVSYVVYKRDFFKFCLGDDESIVHEPSLESDRGEIIAAYAIATTKDGHTYREVMSVQDLEDVRKCSKSPNSGAYTNFKAEMYRKIVSRRLTKSLPSSSSLIEFFKSHDEDFDFNNRKQQNSQQKVFQTQTLIAPHQYEFIINNAETCYPGVNLEEFKHKIKSWPFEKAEECINKMRLKIEEIDNQKKIETVKEFFGEESNSNALSA